MGISSNKVMASTLVSAPAIFLAFLGIHCGGGSPVSNQIIYPQPVVTAAVGLGVTPDHPTVTGTVTPPYSVAPPLPGGIALDPVTGTITGIPTGLSPATTYTVTSANAASTKVQITVGAPGTVKYQYQVLNCPVQMQQHSEWCGIASCACILHYLGTFKEQYELENYAQNITYAGDPSAPFYWNDPIANRGCNGNFGPGGTETDVLTHFGVPCTGRYSALTFDQIKTEIAANRPFMIHWLWSIGQDDHNLVGIGWDERNGDQEVVFMNPREGIVEMPYGWLCYGTETLDSDGGFHSWDKTITLNQ
jgi:hypothetical protein